MTFEFNDQTYTIWFKHLHQCATICVIVREGGEEPARIGVGYTLCSPRDQFSRAYGRSLSMARALANADFRTDIEAELLHAWVNRPRHPGKVRPVPYREICPECRRPVPPEAIAFHQKKFHRVLEARTAE